MCAHTVKILNHHLTSFLLFDRPDEIELRNEVEVSLDLESTTVVLEALLKISEQSFVQFPLRDILNIDCWLATLPAPTLDASGLRIKGSAPSAGLTNLLVSLSKMRLNVTCISCSSPEMEDLSRMLSSADATQDVTRVANNVLEYVTTLLGGEYAQVQIDRMLNEAPKRCPHREEYQERPIASVYQPFDRVQRGDDSITILMMIGIAAGVVVGVTVLVLLFVKVVVRRRNKLWVKTLPSDVVMALHTVQSKERAKEAEMNRLTRSMFRSEAIPLYIRLLVPVTILGNIGFFMSGHLSLGATVNIEANLAGEQITVEQFFEFSMARSTVDIWNAGGRELAILILIFSGIWPYTKQLITLFLWFASPGLVSISKRGSIFLWLDALAKWSMVDIFVLVVSVAAFRVSILSPDLSFLPEGFYSVDLLVVPLWGLYANMIAQLISQVSSHFIIHFHRRIVDVASAEYDRRNGLEIVETVASYDIESSISDGTDSARGEEKFVLAHHSFGRPHRGETETLRPRKGINSVLVVAACILSVLIVVGCALTSFSLEPLGIVGVAVESGQQFEQATTNHSVLTIMDLLYEEAKFLGTIGDYVGLGTLSVLLFVSVLIVPIVQSGALLRMWFRPLTETQRRRSSIFIETLQAWQYVEVYLLAILVSSWQLGPVSEFMINDYCTGLDALFSSLVYYGVLQPNDAQCFRVQARIESATYLLVAGALLLALLNTFIMKAVKQRDRDLWNAKMGITGVSEEAKFTNVEIYSNTVPTEDVDAARTQITPVPVLFTDTFRWFLRSADQPPEMLDLYEVYEDKPEQQHQQDEPANQNDHDHDDDVSLPSFSPNYPPGHHPMEDEESEVERPSSVAPSLSCASRTSQSVAPES